MRINVHLVLNELRPFISSFEKFGALGCGLNRWWGRVGGWGWGKERGDWCVVNLH